VIPASPLALPTLAGTRYDSNKALMAAITGQVRPMSVRRYFRFDPAESLVQKSSSVTVFDIMAEWDTPIPKAARAAFRRSQPITPYPPGKLGIDLGTRGHEVRKLLFAGFGARIARSGYDPEEVLQEVYRGILARNAGKCPFDVTKSSFGHYVHMVCECILNNFHRKEARRREVEQTGFLLTRKGFDTDYVDVAQAMERMPTEGSKTVYDETAEPLMAFLVSIPDNPALAMTPEEREDVRSVLPHMVKSKGRREIMSLTGLSASRVSQATALIREQVRLVV
jgi:hypothetical protein